MIQFLYSNRVPTFVGYLMPKATLHTKSSGNWEDKDVHNFPSDINPKVNVIE